MVSFRVESILDIVGHLEQVSYVYYNKTHISPSVCGGRTSIIVGLMVWKCDNSTILIR